MWWMGFPCHKLVAMLRPGPPLQTLCPQLGLGFISLASGLRTCTLDAPKVLAVEEVPGGGMAHHFPPIGRLLQHRLVPELGGHGQQPQGGEEIVCFLKHP